MEGDEKVVFEEAMIFRCFGARWTNDCFSAGLPAAGGLLASLLASILSGGLSEPRVNREAAHDRGYVFDRSYVREDFRTSLAMTHSGRSDSI